MDLLSSLSDPRYVLEILGVFGAVTILLGAIGDLWKISLRTLSEMAEEIDDFHLKRRASKARLVVPERSNEPSLGGPRERETFEHRESTLAASVMPPGQGTACPTLPPQTGERLSRFP